MSKRKKGFEREVYAPKQQNVAGAMYLTTDTGTVLRLNFKHGSTNTHNKSVRRRLAKGVKVKGK